MHFKEDVFFQRRRVAVWLGTSYQLSSPGGGGGGGGLLGGPGVLWGGGGGGGGGGGSGLLGNHMVFQGNGWGISLLGWPEFSALALL